MRLYSRGGRVWTKYPAGRPASLPGSLHELWALRNRWGPSTGAPCKGSKTSAVSELQRSSGHNMRKHGQFLLALPWLMVAACSSSLEPAMEPDISPLRFQHLTCQELAVAATVTSERIAKLVSIQPSDGDKLAAYLAAGKSEGPLARVGEGSVAIQSLEAKTAVPIAQFRGELTALQVAATDKHCGQPRATG